MIWCGTVWYAAVCDAVVMESDAGKTQALHGMQARPMLQDLCWEGLNLRGIKLAMQGTDTELQSLTLQLR